jgi:hypothetical protein
MLSGKDDEAAADKHIKFSRLPPFSMSNCMAAVCTACATRDLVARAITTYRIGLPSDSSVVCRLSHGRKLLFWFLTAHY